MTTDYRVYKLSLKENLEYFLGAGILLFLIGYMFYMNAAMSLCIALLAIPLRKSYRGLLCQRRANKLLMGFKDCLYSVSSSCAAGCQLPEAIGAAAKETAASWGEDSCISRELSHMYSMYVESHDDVCLLLSDFAKRSGLEEIELFSGACSICRKNGGDMESVALESCRLILEKIEFRDEAQALLADKKTDICVLAAMPLVILLFLLFTSEDYIYPLYTTGAGRALMTISLLIMIAAVVIAIKIMDIKI